MGFVVGGSGDRGDIWFGLLGALPMLLIYVFLFVKDVKELFALRTVSVMSVGFYALLIGLHDDLKKILFL